MHVLISGGPGSGCTSTAKILGELLSFPIFDSDTFFFKPTSPPYQEQNSPEERIQLLSAALEQSDDWIISGSIATWNLDLPVIDYGFFMDTSKTERLRRLELRERERFGSRIDVGGDMHTENREFMEWASAYEDRIGVGRNRSMDREFLIQRCEIFMEIDHSQSLDKTAARIHSLLNKPTNA